MGVKRVNEQWIVFNLEYRENNGDPIELRLG
jgi:hypothetical protein